MKNENEKRIEQIMNSLDGIHRAEASPFLMSKIRNKLQQSEPVLTFRWSWRLALVMATMVLMNVFTISYFMKHKTNPDHGAEAMAKEYSISFSDAY